MTEVAMSRIDEIEARHGAAQRDFDYPLSISERPWSAGGPWFDLTFEMDLGDGPETFVLVGGVNLRVAEFFRDAHKDVSLLLSTIRALQEKNEGLREALKPFAEAEIRGQSTNIVSGETPYTDGRKVLHLVIEGDGFDAYNRARAALKDTPNAD